MPLRSDSATDPPRAEPLRIWIVQNGEELPTDPGPPRLLRQALLADLLTERGHIVTFWTSTFIHQQKVQRPASMLHHRTPSGYQVRLLQTRSYSGNVSKDRLLSHRDAARSFRRLAPAEATPDIVIAGYPTIELAHEVVAFCRQRDVPSLIDFRDQWPDIIEAQAHGLTRLALRPVFSRWRKLQREIVRDATAVCGITDAFVEWALSTAHRQRGPLDRAFHLSPPASRASASELAAASAFWDEQVGTKPEGHIWGAYAGSLGRRSDLMSLVSALDEMDVDTLRRLRVVICGRGDLEDDIRAAADRSPSLIYAGKRNAAEVRELLSRCDIGILPYRRSSDYMISYPNKLGEFLSYGLPVLTGLGGVSGKLLESHGLLIPYAAEDAGSCARAMSRLIADPPSADLSARARAVFESNFSPDVVYPSYADHVENVARAQPAVRASDRLA